MSRFFDHYLRGADNGWPETPDVRVYVEAYTPPEAFPRRKNGYWRSDPAFPLPDTETRTLFLGPGTLDPQSPVSASHFPYHHRPTWGTAGPLCSGGGGEPNGLGRDLRPDEAVVPTFTSAPIAEPLEFVGFPEAVLHLSCTAPVATAVVRLADVHPDGTSALVSFGVLNLTHRDGHAEPAPLEPGRIYEVTVTLNAAGYRFLPGHRLRLSIASASWPLIWPSPYPSENRLYCGPGTPSRLTLPVVSPSALPPPAFKTTPPELTYPGAGTSEPAKWDIVEDVLAGSLTVRLYEGGTAVLPDGRSLFTDERIEMTAYHNDPAHALLFNECNYRLREHGYETHVRSTGAFRSTATDIHLDIQLSVTLNGSPFYQKAWLETVPRRLF
jgi:hypothetical protein